MFNKRGQAAMEFLMTYGWAILVVLVAIGALAYFGVLSPDKFLPERCTGPAGLDCIDKASITASTGPANSGNIQFVIKNNQGYDIQMEESDVAGGATFSNPADIDGSMDCGATPVRISFGGGNCTAQADADDVDVCKLANNEQLTIVTTCEVGKPSDGRTKEDITLKYTNLETNLAHTAKVSITGVAN